MKSLQARLTKVGAALAQPAGFSQVVIYDSETGAPLTPVPSGGVVVWIPDNGRGDRMPPAAGMTDGALDNTRRTLHPKRSVQEG